MLLFDRVNEHLAAILRRVGRPKFDAGANPVERLIDIGMREGVVYDITNVVSLFSDWEREAQKRVPRLPPADVVWAEWLSDDDKIRMRVGVLIQHLKDTGRLRQLLASIDRDTEEAEKIRYLVDFIDDGSPLFDARIFRYPEEFKIPGAGGEIRLIEETKDGRVIQSPSSRSARDTILRRITLDPGSFMFKLGEGGTSISVFSYRYTFEKIPRILDLNFWGPDPLDGYISSDPNQLPWTPFMAFALLHCKNVVTETHQVDEHMRRRVERSGNPPRIEFRTLHLEVPQTVVHRGHYDGAGDLEGPKVRWHLCSGHFKHLVSERFVHKQGQWIWCPAHFRGSKDLGEVNKRYQLTTQGANHGGSPDGRTE